MKQFVLKSVYEKAHAYDRKDAFELLGNCSLAYVVLCDEKGKPITNNGETESGLVWLSASETVWLAAKSPIDVRATI